MRGRVMALFTVVFLGSTPIGGPIVGWIAQVAGPRVALGVGALATLLAGIVAVAIWRGGRRRSDAVRREAEARAVVAAAATESGEMAPLGDAQLPAGGRTR